MEIVNLFEENYQQKENEIKTKLLFKKNQILY